MHLKKFCIRSSGFILTSLLSTVFANSIKLQEGKSQYTLFNPTPHEYLREMSTDRPDTTESPYTVDAGHLQFEISLVDYGYDDEEGVQSERCSILPSNIKIGLLNQVDVQFVFTAYEQIETDFGNSSETSDGFSDDTQIRLKINLWGNDDGDTALAIMPFVKFPTGSDELSNDHVEAGLIIPFAIALPNDFSLGLMAEIDYVFDDTDHEFGLEFVHTATLSHPVTDDLSGYIEYIGIAPFDTSHTYTAIASGGLTYALSPNWIVDCGATAGISDSAEDFTLFAGTSFRF